MGRDKIGDIMSEFHTLCCNKKWYRKSRASYRCSNCEKDVTMHLVFLRETIEENEKDKKDESD